MHPSAVCTTDVNDPLLIASIQAYLRRRCLRSPPEVLLVTAWEAFYDQCSQLIRHFVHSCGLRADDAEECAQEVWLALIEQLRDWHYDPSVGRFSTWLFRIVLHKAADHHRRLERHRTRPLPCELSGSGKLASSTSDPASECERNCDREALDKVLTLLRRHVTPLNYAVFHLRRLEGHSAVKVAEVTGLTPQQVWLRQSRVERRLRELCSKLPENQDFP